MQLDSSKIYTKMNSVMLALILLVVCYTDTVAPCTEDSLRLVGGYGNYEGNVQLCHNGTWGYVCSNSWTSQDAQVVCRQLGYSFTNAVYRVSSYYGMGNHTVEFWLDYVYCKSNEKKLVDCRREYDIGFVKSNCWVGALAGVFCPFGGSCTKGDVRLANFYPHNYGRSEGRVEVCYNNKWGTVCSEWWDWREVRVTCRQLGYGGTYYHYWLNYGAGVGNIWVSRSNCYSGESRLFDCSIRLNDNRCSHNQDVGIRCLNDESTACVHGQYRLWSAYDSTPKSEGILQICYHGRWHSTCDANTCAQSRLACLALGYDGLLATRGNGGFYYGYYNFQDSNRYYRCYTTLSSCRYESWWWWRNRCGHYSRAMGVVCLDNSAKRDGCGDGDVRLVDGKTDNEGRVEYCYKQQWSPMCSLNSQTAHLICKKLGYKRYNWGKVIGQDKFGRSNKGYLFHHLECSTSHTDLSSCPVYVKGGGCYLTPRPCNAEFGLRCFDPGECNDGQVRLMNGTIEQEGRPEVCVNGVWSTICGHRWDQTDGYIFCKQLGYDGPGPIVYSSSTFGDGLGPSIWSSVYCGGWESSIFDCSKSVYPSFTCYDTNIAGVTCKEWCTDGDVKLVGGNFDNEGTVEVCFDNLWGQISDSGWSSADATVVCNELGHKDGIAKPLSGSFYGSKEKVIHLKDVSCTGDEDTLADCTKIQLPLHSGRKLVEEGGTVAGVDCIFDIHSKPTEPPCIDRDDANPVESCTDAGAFRLVNGSVNIEGRVEFCYNKFWTPLCVMDNKVAKVACKELGLTQYSWGSVFVDGEFGNSMNYSLVDSITCSGLETELSQCTVNTGASCLAWCPTANVGLKCFDSTECEDGEARIVDGVIEQEGRMEVCVNGVWGSVCDKGWDKSDAHVACQKLGLSESEPITFHNSHFGGGKYPIVYSNLKCGGWEESFIDCAKDEYLDVNCTKHDVAGIFCGYDCKHGDVRLVGGSKDSEGTVETCLNNFWGLINEAGWSTNDAHVVCRELGYEVEEGTIATVGSHYGKPNKPVLVTDVLCDGDENSLHDCIQKEYSFYEGRKKLDEVEVAGVKCFDPDKCVAPPDDDGGDCSDGALRLAGIKSNDAEGRLEYCYKGRWSKFCKLGETEAAVACNQLGFATNVASVYRDGRYNSPSEHANTSLFLNFTCPTASAASFNECSINDTCRSTCSNAVGIKCYVSDKCTNGSVRLMSGGVSNGRVEVCYNGIWGSVCGREFDHTDAYVVCKELGRGVSAPTVTTSSSYGDGKRPIVYGDVACKGYETKLKECSRKDYGDFSCFHNNTVGIVCQDDCKDGALRLTGGKQGVQGTVEVCYDNLWGMVTSLQWDNKDAKVVCYQMGYYTAGSLAFTDSEFGKPDKTIHLNKMNCKGNEKSLEKCSHERISLNEGEKLYKWIEVAGVSCNTTLRPTATSSMHHQSIAQTMSSTISTSSSYSSSSSSTTESAIIDVTVLPAGQKHVQQNGMTIGMSIFIIILIIIAVGTAIAVTIYFRKKWKKMKTINNNTGAVHLHQVYENKGLDIYADDPHAGKKSSQDLPEITDINIYEEKTFDPPKQSKEDKDATIEEDFY